MAESNFKLVGYGALQERFGLKAIPHYCVSHVVGKGDRKTVVEKHRITEIYPLRYDPGESLGSHLDFALKYEGMNLEVLKGVFYGAGVQELADYILSKPTGKYARKIWFLYELLTGNRLDVPDLTQGNYVDLLDPEEYYTVTPSRVSRQRINSNLPGDAMFCPLVRRTAELKRYEALGLDKQARDLLKQYPEELLRRAVSYLYTKETRSSFEIEHVEPSSQRTTRFVSLLRLAGKENYLNRAALVALQGAIVDERFAATSYRDFQNYVGESAGVQGEIVHYVAPKPVDLPELMDGWLRSSASMMQANIHPVVTAAVTVFGFVFLHPFEDGNGRLHRFLIHHVLSTMGFTPLEMIFPVSAVIVRQMSKYDQTLESYSRPLMENIEYRLNDKGEMTVLNDTVGFYRFIDMTVMAERLFEFVEDTIRHELRAELDFLVQYDVIKQDLQGIVDMPDRKLNLFIRLCLQNKGRLARCKRDEFDKLTETEIDAMENVVLTHLGQKTEP